MNAQQAENLRILIRHMETGCARTLDMDCFVAACGTPACALGEATMCAELKDKLPPAADQAMNAVRDEVADMADMARKRAREG